MLSEVEDRTERDVEGNPDMSSGGTIAFGSSVSFVEANLPVEEFSRSLGDMVGFVVQAESRETYEYALFLHPPPCIHLKRNLDVHLAVNLPST